MKKTMYAVLAACVCALTVLAGCATMNNARYDRYLTVFLPNGTVQWTAILELYNDAQKVKQSQDSISNLAWSSKEELEQQGKKVYQNPAYNL